MSEDQGAWKARRVIPGAARSAAIAILRPVVATAWTVSAEVVGRQRAVADYDGDGRSDVGVYRPAMGTWLFADGGRGVGPYRRRSRAR